MKNLTPHSLTIYCLDGFDPVILPSDGVARVTTVTTEETPIVIGNVTIPVRRVSFGDVVGLPPEGEEVLIAAICTQRKGKCYWVQRLVQIIC